MEDVNNNRLMILHKYFIWADRMRVLFDECLKEPSSSDPEQEKKHSIELTMYMSLWYGMFYAVIEGWEYFNFHDESIDKQLALQPKNVELLKRYRNGVFHVQNQYNDVRFEELYEQGIDFPNWIRDLREMFSKYFLSEIGKAKN